MSKTLSPMVNVDVKMPRKMMDALNSFEAISICTGVKSVTEDQVRQFLADRHGEKFAAQFKPEYLFIAEDRGHPSPEATTRQ